VAFVLYFSCVAKEKTELWPLPSEQYWCAIVMLLPEAEELIESSVHHKTTLPRSNEQSSAIRPRGQRPHIKKKKIPMHRSNLFIPFSII
jgi:hypothetical protein